MHANYTNNANIIDKGGIHLISFAKKILFRLSERGLGSCSLRQYEVSDGLEIEIDAVENNAGNNTTEQ